ncbi:hypothetical protein EDB85DRAFT_1899794 [Lactarius pseudohatsudake]|nr:hypothetical protein EDB85DRAFT_1899794 [Lactarius pseudohatsudake]
MLRLPTAAQGVPSSRAVVIFLPGTGTCVVRWEKTGGNLGAWPLPVSAHQAIAGYISALGSEPKHVASVSFINSSATATFGQRVVAWQREPRPTRYVFLPSKAWGPVPVADDATHAEIPLDLTNCPVWAPTAYSTFPQYSFVRKASNGTVSFRLCALKRLVVVGGWGGYVAEFDGDNVVGCHNCMKKLFYDSWAVINHNQVYRSYHKSVGCSAIVRFGEPTRMEKRSGSRQGARGAKRTDNWLPERRRFIDARVKGAQTQHFSNFTYPSPNLGMSWSKVGTQKIVNPAGGRAARSSRRGRNQNRRTKIGVNA